MPENLDEIRKQFNELLHLEVGQMKQDIEFAETMTGSTESELILSNRILENDYIALEARYEMALEINEALEKKSRSLEKQATLQQMQIQHLKDEIFWERVASTAFAVIVCLLWIAAAVIL